MTMTATDALPTSHDLRARDVRSAPQEPIAAPNPDKPVQRPGHTRLVASWSADARPTATCRRARPNPALQRQLIARLIG